MRRTGLRAVLQELEAGESLGEPRKKDPLTCLCPLAQGRRHGEDGAEAARRSNREVPRDTARSPASGKAQRDGETGLIPLLQADLFLRRIRRQPLVVPVPPSDVMYRFVLQTAYYAR